MIPMFIIKLINVIKMKTVEKFCLLIEQNWFYFSFEYRIRLRVFTSSGSSLHILVPEAFSDNFP